MMMLSLGSSPGLEHVIRVLKGRHCSAFAWTFEAHCRSQHASQDCLARHACGDPSCIHRQCLTWACARDYLTGTRD